MSTFIIAEAGANHDRDFEKAKRLIRVAAAAGADAVKFQLYTSKKLYVEGTGDIGKFKDVSNLISSIEMPPEWIPDIMEECDRLDIEFMCTPFDEESCDVLVEHGMKRIKIAAFESSDLRLVRYFAKKMRPIVFSAGVGSSTPSAVWTIKAIRETGNMEQITVLHCNSSYPTPFTDINLGQIRILRDVLREFSNIDVGLSDHTTGILVPPIAVTHGATVIEKHFTLDRSSKGPDHPFAIEPDELHQMCRDIRRAEVMMGRRTQSLTISERDGEMQFARRSLVLLRNVKSGDVFNSDDLTSKRPHRPGDVGAEKYDQVLGCTALKDLTAGSPLMEGDVSWK